MAHDGAPGTSGTLERRLVDTPSAPPGVLEVPGFANLRDVGGLVTTDGGRVHSRRLLRADMPPTLTAEARARLRAIPVTTVVDLRDEDEVSASGPVYAEAGFRVVRRPVFDGSAASFVEQEVTLLGLYRHLITVRGRTLADAVRAIAQADDSGAVLVHCTAGKDRTGLTIALALLAAGASASAVVADYALTQRLLRGPWLEHRLGALQAHHGTDLSGSVELLAGSPPRVLTTILAEIDAAWGSPVGFLQGHGLTTAELDRLRVRLASAPADPRRSELGA